MTDPDHLVQRIEAVIKTVTARNPKTQEAKKQGPWGWIAAIVLALGSLIGIGVAMWLAHRRGRELATAQTQLQYAKIDQGQKVIKAKREPLLHKRMLLMADLKREEMIIQEHARSIHTAEGAHEEQRERINALKAWAEVNAI